MPFTTLDKIRVETLSKPFVYRRMDEIEENRKAKPDLPHRHDYFVVIYVEEAEGQHHVDFQLHPLTPHTIYFVSPEQIHHLKIIGKPKGHVLLFTVDFLQQYSIGRDQLFDLELFFNCDEAPPVMVPVDYRKELQSILQGIARECITGKPFQMPVLGAWLKLFFLTSKRIKVAGRQDNESWLHRSAAIVRAFKNDVEHKFRKWHKVADYAEVQHLTPNYLNEVIKSETGSSAKTMIQHRITLEAKRLALYSELSAKEVAWELGFEDVPHFSRFFKKQEGKTFTAFREEIRKNDNGS